MVDENRGWTMLESKGDGEVHVLFIRVKEYEEEFPHLGMPEKLTLIWVYEDSESGMPSSDEMAEMEGFENYLCDAVEDDLQATLSVVFTGRGERAWVFYTRDMEEFMGRLSGIPHPNGPYPIEIEHEHDAGWEFHAQFPC